MNTGKYRRAKILAYTLGHHKGEVFLKLKELLESFGITQFYTGYGLQVAALAGVPPVVIQQARQRLRLLERQMLRRELLGRATTVTPQLALFGEAAHPTVAALAELDLDVLNPEQALAELERLKMLGGL